MAKHSARTGGMERQILIRLGRDHVLTYFSGNNLDFQGKMKNYGAAL